MSPHLHKVHTYSEEDLTSPDRSPFDRSRTLSIRSYDTDSPSELLYSNNTTVLVNLSFPIVATIGTHITDNVLYYKEVSTMRGSTCGYFCPLLTHPLTSDTIYGVAIIWLYFRISMTFVSVLLLIFACSPCMCPNK